jgi:hypothetical protein
MIRLPQSLNAWNSPEFKDVLKRELEQLGPAQLPLQQALSSTSYALDDEFSVMVISATEEPGVIRAKIGVFFTGIIAGCSCANDPTPVEPQAEYSEMQIAIDKTTAEATVSIAEQGVSD